MSDCLNENVFQASDTRAITLVDIMSEHHLAASKKLLVLSNSS